ncbi:3,4-dihydroxy-2-butanone-4-phosphate synthase [Jatrophihabitans sp.]|jgi:3,4-dihydroxy 2-butanone 4-phosphate synthase/GTP cyclohydrolase II|uniref:3,4-dihydroxy-2-butanone-4-phosphate synthase n=1 Tax=Jatrophihabitans sp. TaxID=1932789 RepID=UPI002F184519
MTLLATPFATAVIPVQLSEIEDVVVAIARGEMVVVVDDENRENEGDLIVAAEHATSEVINFMITQGRGLVCTALTASRAAELELPYMVARNEDHLGTAFTVSVDGTPLTGVTTGISAPDRAATIKLLISGAATQLQRPGHIFPLIAREGGVLERPGHTEAAVDLARMAGCEPVGVIVEIIGDDGEMLRLEQLARFAARHGLLITSIEKLQAYLARNFASHS